MLNSYRGNVYAGFSRGGLIEIDDEGKEHSMLNIAESDNSVYSYLRDSRGNEWVGLGYAFYRRDAGKNEFMRVNETGFNWIFNIFEAHDGTIWIATMGNGIWKYTPSTGKFKSYIYATKIKQAIVALYGRVVVKLIAWQTVFSSKELHGFTLWIEFYQTFVRTKP
jgi:ligand-binding sensor domain-containing protein